MAVRPGAHARSHLLGSPYLTLLACQQVPKRIYTLEELRLNKIEAEKFLSPADETLNTVRTVLQVLPRSPDVPAASLAIDGVQTKADHHALTHDSMRSSSSAYAARRPWLCKKLLDSTYLGQDRVPS